MKQHRSGLLFLMMLTFCGCAWQRIPVPPQYSASAPIPIRLGIILDESQSTAYYGPGIINLRKEMKLFESIIYPYRKGDILDGVMKLSIKGGWKGSGRGAGVLIGLTLGLASAGVGPSMTGVHYATAVLSKGATETGKYTVHVESNVTWGMAANTTEVSNKSDDLQRRKIAVEMAKKFEADRTLIIKAFGK